MEVLRLATAACERVAGDDVSELRPRAQQHDHVQAEAAADLPLDRAAQPRGAADGAAEHDVAALQVRRHVLRAHPGEEVAQVGHRDPVSRAEVDPAQKCGVDVCTAPRHGPQDRTRGASSR